MGMTHSHQVGIESKIEDHPAFEDLGLAKVKLASYNLSFTCQVS